ncbi:uncharacterized protein LOC107361656 [Tetranychus urticae]|uniref:uncharacterized protein LOC107361656 n=1 Tax=Tetranychus urticae TaxID=32264 RepID=UPI00077BD6EA|nr:uncharacterized protein LOC107361656 [Tetranychus urticae]
MWPLSPLVFRSLSESGSFVLKLFPPSPYSISCKSFQRCFKSKNSTNYTCYLTRSSADEEKLFDIALNGPSLTQPRSSDTNKPESISKTLLTESNLRRKISNNNGFNNGLHTKVNDGAYKDRFDSLRDDKSKDRTLQIDEKFRLHLEGKTPSQMVDILRTYRHLIDLGRLKTFIKQISCAGYIYEYHLSPEEFELIHNMLLAFPEMTSDISNLTDVSCFVSQLRVDSKIPMLQYIAKQMIRKIDELSFDEVFNLYKSLQAIRVPLLEEGSDITGQFDVLNDDVLRARHLLISNVAFRVETSHFDETDIVTLCEVFRRINKELFAKEAIDILSKSIVSMSSYMRSKNSTDIIAGLTSTNGAKILSAVVASKDKAAIKRYRDLIDLSVVITGRLTNSNMRANPSSTQYISDCFFRMLLKEANKFNQASFWFNFLSEIDFNRHKLDLHSWQNLLTLINRFRIYCPSIIDTIAPIVIRNANAYIQDRQISPIPYIRLMAECYHKPLTANWDKFLSILLHPKKLTEVPVDRSLSLLSRLAILEDYSKIRDFDADLIKSSLTAHKNSAQVNVY